MTKKNINLWIPLLQLLCALTVLGSVFLWAPVCQKLLTLENGNMVAMKCAHSAKLFVSLAILMGICAIATILKKTTDKSISFVVLAITCLLFLNTYSSPIGIGICMNTSMACNTTAIWVRVSAALSGVTALLSIFTGDRSRRIPE